MALSMFQASVPVYIKMLNGLANGLKKGAAHYSEHKLDEGSLLSYRLFPELAKPELQDGALGGAHFLRPFLDPAQRDQRPAVQPGKAAVLLRNFLVANHAVQSLRQLKDAVEFAGQCVQHRRAIQPRDLAERMTIGDCH